MTTVTPLDFVHTLVHIQSMQYVWDKAKNARNVDERGIDFADGARIFDGPVLQWTRLPQNYPELRVMAVGVVEGRELLVVYTEIDPMCRRIMSVRRASRKERSLYAKAFPSPAE